tara:strand:+ start:45 stop:383 length:339 start_codon:yes stop_codon:yes gene_type:complete
MTFEKIYTSVRIADEAVQTTSKQYGFTLAELREDNRRRTYSDMRSMLMHILRTNTGLSLTEIGFVFSRDHSCVIHNVKKVDDLLKTDDGFLMRYEHIKKYMRKILKILSEYE